MARSGPVIVEARLRAARALELHLMGLTFQAIADSRWPLDQDGNPVEDSIPLYNSASASNQAVHREMKRLPKLDAELFRESTIRRYEGMLERYLPESLDTANFPMTGVVFSILDRLTKLYGADVQRTEIDLKSGGKPIQGLGLSGLLAFLPEPEKETGQEPEQDKPEGTDPLTKKDEP